MPTFKAIPVDMISAPNFYSALANNRWELTSPNATTIWFSLNIVDSMGTRPYMVASGATLEVTFQRADSYVAQTMPPLQLTQTPRSVVKNAAPHAQNRSLFSVAMTTQDIQTIVSGSTKFKLTETAVETTWLMDWSIYKKLTSPGF